MTFSLSKSLAFVVTCAAATCNGASPALCHLTWQDLEKSPYPFKTQAEESHFHENYVLAIAGDKRNRLDLVRKGVPPIASDLIKEARHQLARSNCVMWFVPASRMRTLNDPTFVKVAGTNNPFQNIDKAWKGFASGTQERVSYLVVGWIPSSYPSKSERDGTVVIEMSTGDPGFAEYAIAPTKPIAEVQWPVDVAMDFISSAQGSKLMGRYFYVVPDNTTLKRRVRIDLVDKQTGKRITHTPCDSNSCYPKLVFGEVEYTTSDGSTGRVCGSSGACPQFSELPDFKITKTSRPQQRERPR